MIEIEKAEETMLQKSADWGSIRALAGELAAAAAAATVLSKQKGAGNGKKEEGYSNGEAAEGDAAGTEQPRCDPRPARWTVVVGCAARVSGRRAIRWRYEIAGGRSHSPAASTSIESSHDRSRHSLSK